MSARPTSVALSTLEVSSARDLLRRPEVIELDQPFSLAVPFGGIKRGSTVSVSGLQSTSLILSLASSATRSGWAAVVGLPQLIPTAAEEFDIELERLVLIPAPDAVLPEVVASLIDALDLVVCAARLKHADIRRLVARNKQRGNVLVLKDTPDADLVLESRHTTYNGIGEGHGRILSSSTEVEVSSRRIASNRIAGAPSVVNWTR